MRMWKAILAGQLIVNLPAVVIIMVVTFVGAFIVSWQLALLSGSLIAWVWWSFTVPRWRDWAESIVIACKSMPFALV